MTMRTLHLLLILVVLWMLPLMALCQSGIYNGSLSVEGVLSVTGNLNITGTISSDTNFTDAVISDDLTVNTTKDLVAGSLSAGDLTDGRVVYGDGGKLVDSSTFTINIQDLSWYSLAVGGDGSLEVLNTDQSNTLTQTASILLSPDSRSAAYAGIRAYKSNNSDFSSGANRDYGLRLLAANNNASFTGYEINNSGEHRLFNFSGTELMSIVGSASPVVNVTGTIGADGFIVNSGYYDPAGRARKIIYSPTQWEDSGLKIEIPFARGKEIASPTTQIPWSWRLSYFEETRSASDVEMLKDRGFFENVHPGSPAEFQPPEAQMQVKGGQVVIDLVGKVFGLEKRIYTARDKLQEILQTRNQRITTLENQVSQAQTIIQTQNITIGNLQTAGQNLAARVTALENQ